ncbi:MAG: hypothetical protein AB7P52_05240 [Alphaproteobacteria bacterium]
MKLRYAALAALSACLVGSSAQAITNADVLDIMSEKERFAYVAATVEMTAYLATLSGNRTRSQCIVDWYFHTENAPGNVLQALERFRDNTPQALIYAMINQQCGNP